MTVTLILQHESMFKEVKAIGVHENSVAIARSGSCLGVPWATAIIKVSPDGFGRLAEAMLEANASEALKAFELARSKHATKPETPN